ncbi:MAG: Sec-independent protein translocase protein TatB [Actinobacteria bacterium]|nr:Sec-independent protein translocase protein TatB [Actinomycetota bacterium]
MDVGFGEMLMLAVLALLIFGPERLPGIARNAGRLIGQVRREATSTFDALRSEVELDELQSLGSDLRRERDELQRRSRIDRRALEARPARRTADDDVPPPFDPHAT